MKSDERIKIWKGDITDKATYSQLIDEAGYVGIKVFQWVGSPKNRCVVSHGLLFAWTYKERLVNCEREVGKWNARKITKSW